MLNENNNVSPASLSQAAVITNGPDETRRFGAQLARIMRPGTVMALHGNLGAGKTCLVQGLAEGLGINEVVNSPTYTIIHEYKGELPLFHVDLYRIEDEMDAVALGLEEYFDAPGVTAIEWPEHAAFLLRGDVIHIRIEHGEKEDQRIINVRGIRQ